MFAFRSLSLCSTFVAFLYLIRQSYATLALCNYCLFAVHMCFLAHASSRMLPLFYVPKCLMTFMARMVMYRGTSMQSGLK